MVRIPSDHEPTHPCEMLLQEFLLSLGMTQRELADCDPSAPSARQRVNEVVRGRRGVTSSTALRLSRFFGASPDFGSIFISAGTSTTPDAPRRIRSTASSHITSC